MVRLGLGIGGPTVLYRSIWPTYFAAPFGVAAVAARLYSLDATQTAHALALALSFASPGVSHHNAESSSRWFAIGHAARNGLIAVQAAQAGFTSDLNLLEGSFLDDIYGIRPNITALTENLGWRIAIDDTSFKPWCAARRPSPQHKLSEMTEVRRVARRDNVGRSPRPAALSQDDRSWGEVRRPRIASHKRSVSPCACRL